MAWSFSVLRTNFRASKLPFLKSSFHRMPIRLAANFISDTLWAYKIEDTLRIPRINQGGTSEIWESWPLCASNKIGRWIKSATLELVALESKPDFLKKLLPIKLEAKYNKQPQTRQHCLWPLYFLQHGFQIKLEIHFDGPIELEECRAGGTDTRYKTPTLFNTELCQFYRGNCI